MRVLFIGDVVGGPGRRGLKAAMPLLRERYEPDLTIVNGENSAGGMGITEKTAKALFDAGAGVITTGNHVYRHREAYDFLDRAERVIRPANYPHVNPARATSSSRRAGMRVGVINLSGAIGLRVARLPFHEVDSILERIEADCVVVDFHAEVSSEKVAIGWHPRRPRRRGLRHPHPRPHRRRAGAAGRHRLHLRRRHDRLANQRARGQAAQVLEAMTTQMPVKFETAEDDVWVMGAVVEVNERGLADSIEQIMVPAPTDS
jgi:calcineurin-like phosphoesterase